MKPKSTESDDQALRATASVNQGKRQKGCKKLKMSFLHPFRFEEKQSQGSSGNREKSCRPYRARLLEVFPTVRCFWEFRQIGVHSKVRQLSLFNAYSSIRCCIRRDFRKRFPPCGIFGSRAKQKGGGLLKTVSRIILRSVRLILHEQADISPPLRSTGCCDGLQSRQARGASDPPKPKDRPVQSAEDRYWYRSASCRP